MVSADTGLAAMGHKGCFTGSPIHRSTVYGPRFVLRPSKVALMKRTAVKQDLYADKPWAWSPLLATMNRLSFHKLDTDDSPLPPWTSDQPAEDVTPLYRGTEKEGEIRHLEGDPGARRKWFAVEENRKQVVLGPRVSSTTRTRSYYHAGGREY
jgi:hypothetical protein